MRQLQALVVFVIFSITARCQADSYLVVPSLSGSVSIISAESNIELQRIYVGSFPKFVVMAPDGSAAYVAAQRYGDSEIWKISLTNLTLELTVTVPLTKQFIDLQISPDGNTLAASEDFRG